MLRKAALSAVAGALLCGAAVTAASAAPHPSSPELRALNIEAGRWTYSGTMFSTPVTKAGKWTWNLDCGWEKNDEFLVCSFDMNWPEGPDRSVSITTYNKLDRAYWYYEMMDDAHGNKPVVSRMTIAGNTWTKTTPNVDANGHTLSRFRIVYTYTTPTTVEVTFKSSKDGVHWSTLGNGIGHKVR